MSGAGTALLIAAASFPTLNNDHEALSAHQQECFATAMIGYDYVVNSRVGVPIERALNTVTVDNRSPLIRDTFKYELKTVVENAYRWQNTPHMYAVKVLHDCAFSQGATAALER